MNLPSGDGKAMYGRPLKSPAGMPRTTLLVAGSIKKIGSGPWNESNNTYLSARTWVWCVVPPVLMSAASFNVFASTTAVGAPDDDPKKPSVRERPPPAVDGPEGR